MRAVPELWVQASSLAARAMLGVALSMSLPVAAYGADGAKTFPNPEAAVAGLVAAVKAQDQEALRSLFGADLSDLENADRVQATNELLNFARALDEQFRLVRESPTRSVLEMGSGFWPFPIPLVQRDGRWFFDTAAGKEELLNRRIGKNELSVLLVMRAYVEAQREYASRDRDGDEVLEYAQKICSTPGKTDGLFWPPDLNGEISPLGPGVARAQAEGYFGDTPMNRVGPQPFHGYLFRLLSRQGKRAPGGKYEYVINGNMIGGFALVAWPAEYRGSGVMTFIVNQQGKVYQKDLGNSTAKVVRQMSAYDPDRTWQVSSD